MLARRRRHKPPSTRRIPRRRWRPWSSRPAPSRTRRPGLSTRRTNIKEPRYALDTYTIFDVRLVEGQPRLDVSSNTDAEALDEFHLFCCCWRCFGRRGLGLWQAREPPGEARCPERYAEGREQQVLQRGAAPSLLVASAQSRYSSLLFALVLAVPLPALHKLRRGTAPHSPLARKQLGSAQAPAAAAFTQVLGCKTEMLCKSRQRHPSKRRSVSAPAPSREVGQPGAGAQPEPELARSILVLHQLASHRRPRDGWGSLIRIGSSAATSEQLHRPADTPTAAPAGQKIDSACCNRR